MIVALFSKKISLFVNGRNESFSKLSIFKKEDAVYWFHAASLGEFEQGRPIIEQLKTDLPSCKILLTFFSPSGYEIQKNYQIADVVCYLPLDSNKNVKRFFDLVQPKLAIFIKYEFWPNFLIGLQQRNIPTILISGIFRKNQVFFNPLGGFMKKALQTFDHFFVQDERSKELLNSIACNRVTVAGDTRFDRVAQILEQDNALDFISDFVANQYTLVAGSTWEEDEKLLINYINNELSDNEKVIIAPHNIKPKEIASLKQAIQKKTVLYSNKEGKKLSDYQVFIVDTIGILTKIYSVASVAYVGGGLSKNGVHNILEPAIFGVPIVIGTKYKKYKEVVDLVGLKGCISISNQQEFSSIFTTLKQRQAYSEELGEINQNYIKHNMGATKQIMNYIEQLK